MPFSNPKKSKTSIIGSHSLYTYSGPRKTTVSNEDGDEQLSPTITTLIHLSLTDLNSPQHFTDITCLSFLHRRRLLRLQPRCESHLGNGCCATSGMWRDI